MNVKNPNKIVESLKSFPFYSFKGSPREIGRQYGQACRELINVHQVYALERLSKKVKVASIDVIEEAALEYRPFVQKYAPYFDEEIQGLAEGAEISLGMAYFLQLRAEIYQYLDTTDECTTFAISAEATNNGTPLIGQNADLPAFYQKVGVVIETIPDNGPATLMLTPAGQISYIGINSKGLGIFANFLVCDGWRIGFPRYLLSRLGLTSETIEEAVEIIDSTFRSSSRNLIIMDKKGDSIDLETIPTKIGRVKSENGLLAHSNHFISEELLIEERKVADDLINSQIRLQRIKELLNHNHGSLNSEKMKEILRDRENAPHTLCRMPGDFGEDSITFASVIAEPSEGNMWIAVGPPHQHEYYCYSFTEQ